MVFPMPICYVKRGSSARGLLLFSFHFLLRILLTKATINRISPFVRRIIFLYFVLLMKSPSSTGNLIFGLLISGISSCLTSLNFWTTILNLRSYYLTLKTMPLFPWALLITGGMLLLTLPILSGALLMVLADLHSNFHKAILGREITPQDKSHVFFGGFGNYSWFTIKRF